jgi:hypothetical protein
MIITKIKEIVFSNQCDADKVSRLKKILSNDMSRISDAGHGYIVRLPGRPSKFFRYAPRSGESFSKQELDESKQEQLNKAKEYRDSNNRK